MSLQTLIKNIYGEITFTGLYSFQFLDAARDTITEIFFMIPPKTKTMDESTRSSSVATFGGNFINDAGNSIKQVTLSGDLFFPYVGDTKNPVARSPEQNGQLLNGYEEFMKLRWMLIRYRDYTMTKNGVISDPGIALSADGPKIQALYSHVSKNLTDKIGALYDTVELVFHDYDMNDHYFCKVNSFSSNQSDSKYNAVNYTIQLECYEPYRTKKNRKNRTKKPANEDINSSMQMITNLDYDSKFDIIQPQIGYNVEFLSALVSISKYIEELQEENYKIQAGKTPASKKMPEIVESILDAVGIAMDNFVTFFISAEDLTDFELGDKTFDDLLDFEQIEFFNSLQKVKILAETMKGTLSSVVSNEPLRYYSNADIYTLSEEQFDSDEDSFQIDNNTTFYYYTVLAGDSARVIALRELKDANKFMKILQMNDITENDFIEGNIVGQAIKIPILSRSQIAKDDNFVYEKDSSDIKIFFHGKDIATGVNKEILLSGTGDLLYIEGIDNTISSIESRLSSTQGSLNIFNPDWGIIPIGNDNAPFLVQVDRYIESIQDQLSSEPRIAESEIKYDKLRWKGERIYVPIKVKFIGSDDTQEVAVDG